MTIFKNILERMAAGQMNGLYAKPVWTLEHGEIQVYEGSDPDGTLIVDSCNQIPVCGTVHSLHPAVTVLETAFHGRSEIHYSVDKSMLEERTELRTEGLLILFNGEEAVVPLHILTDLHEAKDNHSGNTKASGNRKSKAEINNYLKEKAETAGLARSYLELLCALKKESDQSEISLIIRKLSVHVNELCEMRPECIRYRLFEAILAAKKKDVSHAVSLEKRMRNIITSARKSHPVEFALLRYLQYEIARMDQNYQEAANKKKQLTEFLDYTMENAPLETELICLYAEEGLGRMESDPMEFWERLHAFYDKGNNSPFLYFYGICALQSSILENEQELFTDTFVLKCLNAGARYGMISRVTAERILTGSVSLRAPYLLQLYRSIYELYPEREMLLPLCRLMIQMDKKDEKAFPYYRQAVREKLTPARLFDYYMYALPDSFEEPVEREILVYYSADAYVNPEIYLKLCVNLLQYYRSDATLMDLYMPHMEAFIRTQISHRRSGANLAYLIDEVITQDMLDDELRDGILPMLFLAEISAELPDGCRAVYDNGLFKASEQGTFENGGTVISLFGGMGNLRLFDQNDRKIGGISLEITPLIQNEELMRQVCSEANQTPVMRLLRTGKWLKNRYDKVSENSLNSCYDEQEPENLRLCMDYLEKAELSDELKRNALRYAMERTEAGDDFNSRTEFADVMYAHMDLLEKEQAAKGFTYLVQNEHITDALRLWNRLDGTGLDPDDVESLARILVNHYEKADQPVLEKILLSLMAEDRLDENMLLYLASGGYRSMEKQVRILMTCRNQNVAHQELSAQILLRQLMQRDPDWSVLQLTYDELVNHEQYALLNYAALTDICYGYLFHNVRPEINLAAFVQGEILFSGKTDTLNDFARLAFIKQMQDEADNEENVFGIRRQICESVQNKGYLLDFVQREAATTGLSSFPVLTVNMSEYGIFGEDMQEMLKTYPEKLHAEYRLKDTNQKFSCVFKPACECLYSAVLVAFAGENIEYRLCFAEKMTDWTPMKPWNYYVRNPEGLSERYLMLQNLSEDFEQGSVSAEDLQKYEVTMNLIHEYGKVL